VVHAALARRLPNGLPPTARRSRSPVWIKQKHLMENTLMSQKLSSKIALVTGGSSGIGLATAKRFASEGAHVFITGRRQTELDAAAKELGGNATAVRSDVANLADLDRLFDTIRAQKGRLDVLFANAGGGALAPLGQITEEHFDKTFNTNVRGLLFTVQKALPLMPPGSSIILNASTTSIKGTPAFSVYSATKAAVRSFARNWTLDLKERKIRVNAVSPGVVPTPGYDLMGLTKEQVQGFVDFMVPTIPLGRVGIPDEIAKAVVFLASDDSSFVNGIELFVDGGMAQI
jgi:NAD(P)-dependent dehydrogenase (short-subunit alcohol dehydrogenase family)